MQALKAAVIVNNVRRTKLETLVSTLLQKNMLNMVESRYRRPCQRLQEVHLQNATSVASTLLTTESVVAEIKEDTPAQAMPQGGMGMM